MFLFVQRFAALDIILQSLYHALCTFSGPYKCGLLAIFINFVFYFCHWYSCGETNLTGRSRFRSSFSLRSPDDSARGARARRVHQDPGPCTLRVFLAKVVFLPAEK